MAASNDSTTLRSQLIECCQAKRLIPHHQTAGYCSALSDPASATYLPMLAREQTGVHPIGSLKQRTLESRIPEVLHDYGAETSRCRAGHADGGPYRDRTGVLQGVLQGIKEMHRDRLAVSAWCGSASHWFGWPEPATGRGGSPARPETMGAAKLPARVRSHLNLRHPTFAMASPGFNMAHLASSRHTP